MSGRAPGCGAGEERRKISLRNIRHAAPGLVPRDALRGTGPAIYEAIWHEIDRTEARGQVKTFSQWATGRSVNRKWWATTGGEWAALADASTFTAAYHVLRLLASGISGGVAARTTADCARFSKLCRSCGSPDTAATWITPDHQQPGAS